MTPDQERHIDAKFDSLTQEVNNLRVKVEHRLTKVEERVGIIGVITGLIGGFIASFRGH